MSTQPERQVKAWPFLYSVVPGQRGLVKNVPRVRVKLTPEPKNHPGRKPRERVLLTPEAADPWEWGIYDLPA